MAKTFARMNPKFIASMMLLTVFALSMTTGCSSPKVASKNPSVNEIRDKITQTVGISDMKEGDSSKLKKLYGIDAGKLDGFALYTAPSNIRADEVALLKVKDANDVSGIKDKISKRIDSQAASFKDYLPEQYFLIEKHVLKSNGNCILFVVSKDATKIEAVFDDSFK